MFMSGSTNPFTLEWSEIQTQLLSFLESYTESGIILHEGLQNAVDSFFDIDEKEFSEISDPKIHLTFDLEENKIIIKDNGTGINIDKWKNLMKMHSSPKGAIIEDKSITTSPIRRALKGSQGVGLKLTMLSTNFFQIETAYKDESGEIVEWTFEVKEWFSHLQNSENGDEFDYGDPPPVKQSEKSSTGTVITYSIDENFQIEDSNFSLRSFLIDLMYLEFIRRNYTLKDRSVIISSDFKEQEEYGEETSLAEMLFDSIKFSPNPAYLLDLNPIIINDYQAHFLGDKSKILDSIRDAEYLCEKHSDDSDKIAKLQAEIDDLKTKLDIINFQEEISKLAKPGLKPPKIELFIEIKGEEPESLLEEFLDHLLSYSTEQGDLEQSGLEDEVDEESNGDETLDLKSETTEEGS
jgi:hypothetical protein